MPRKRTPFEIAKKREGKVFQVKGVNEWTYGDRFADVENPLLTETSYKPHLVLCDQKGLPRFTLRNGEDAEGVLMVDAVQRVRTQYEDRQLTFFWMPEEETRHSQALKRKIGLHPAEMLISEWLFRNRKRIQRTIRKGQTPYLFLHNTLFEGRPKELQIFENVYRPLIDRFFAGKPERLANGLRYRLNLKRKRVQEILAME